MLNEKSNDAYGLSIDNKVVAECHGCGIQLKGRDWIYINKGNRYCRVCNAELAQDLETDISKLTKAVDRLTELLNKQKQIEELFIKKKELDKIVKL